MCMHVCQSLSLWVPIVDHIYLSLCVLSVCLYICTWLDTKFSYKSIEITCFAIWGPNDFLQNPYKSVRTRSLNSILFAMWGPDGFWPNPHKSVCTRSLNAIVFTIRGPNGSWPSPHKSVRSHPLSTGAM